MNKMFALRLLFLAATLIAGFSTSAKTPSTGQSNDLSSHHQTNNPQGESTPVSPRDDKSSSESTATETKEASTHDDSSSSKPPKSIAQKASLANEEVSPSLPDYTKRGSQALGDYLSVNSWGGLPRLHIPLIHIPGNDGLSLDVTLTYDEYTATEPTSRKSMFAYGQPVSVAPRIVSGTMGQHNLIVFRDELGETHSLYYSSSTGNTIDTEVDYQSRDHCHAVYIQHGSGKGFVIESPDGKTYNIGMATTINYYYVGAVSEIISKHGKDKVQYEWNPSGSLRCITLYSEDYHVNLEGGNKTPGRITQTDGHTISYDIGRYRVNLSDEYHWSLGYKNTTLPNGSSIPVLSTVADPYYKLTSFAYELNKKFPSSKEPSGAYRFGEYRVSSYSVQGPNIPLGLWEYNYGDTNTQIKGPIQTQLITYVPVGQSDEKKVTENHYVDGLVQSEQTSDSQSWASLLYVHYDYDFRNLGPGQNTGYGDNNNPISTTPYQSEITKVTYSTSKSEPATFTNTYQYDDDGLVKQESLNALNGRAQSISCCLPNCHRTFYQIIYHKKRSIFDRFLEFSS